MKRLKTIQNAGVVGAIVLAFFVAIAWQSLQEISPVGYMIYSETLPGLGLLLAFFLLILSAVSLLLCIVHFKQWAFKLLIYSLFIALFSITGIQLGEMLRMHKFIQFTERSKPLIRAIKTFIRKEYRLPINLEELIPNYLSKMPSTGMAAYPDYHFKVIEEEEGEPRWRGNAWILSVRGPLGIRIDPDSNYKYDKFIYYPNGQYPNHFVRVKDWGYYYGS